MSDEELDKEAEEFCKRLRRQIDARIVSTCVLTVKRSSHIDGLIESHECLTYQSWFFKTFEQDTFDYHLCLN